MHAAGPERRLNLVRKNTLWTLVPERAAPFSTGMTRIRSGDARLRRTGIRPEGGNVRGFLSILVSSVRGFLSILASSVIAVVSWVSVSRVHVRKGVSCVCHGREEMLPDS